MSDNDKTGTEEENFILHCIQNDQKDRRKLLRRSRILSFSDAIVQKLLEKSTYLLNDLKNHENRILILSDEKIFSVDPALDK